MVNCMKRKNSQQEIKCLLIRVCTLCLLTIVCNISGIFLHMEFQQYNYLIIAGTFANCVLLCALVHDIALPMLKLHDLLNKTLDDSSKAHSHLSNSYYNHPLLKDALLYTSKASARLEREKTLEALKKEAELNSLRSQINPHFLYNTLDSIRGQLMIQGFNEAADNIESLSKMFRYSINPHTVYNTFEQELDNVRDYMRIMHFRLGDRLHFEVILEGEKENLLSCEMPKLTLQPIIENAIQHGLEHVVSNGLITLRAYEAQDGLNILISDNGCGMSSQRLSELNSNLYYGISDARSRNTGIALVNVNERIRMTYGGKPYGLHVNSDLGIGTQVHILLPLRTAPVSISECNSLKEKSPSQ